LLWTSTPKCSCYLFDILPWLRNQNFCRCGWQTWKKVKCQWWGQLKKINQTSEQFVWTLTILVEDPPKYEIVLPLNLQYQLQCRQDFLDHHNCN
jgi:hypothetical protein